MYVPTDKNDGEFNPKRAVKYHQSWWEMNVRHEMQDRSNCLQCPMDSSRPYLHRKNRGHSLKKKNQGHINGLVALVVSCCAIGDTLRVTLDPEGVTHVHQFILMYSICLCTYKYVFTIHLLSPTNGAVRHRRPQGVAASSCGGMRWWRMRPPSANEVAGDIPRRPKDANVSITHWVLPAHVLAHNCASNLCVTQLLPTKN